MFRSLVIAAVVSGAGLYTYTTKGTFDPDRAVASSAAHNRVMTSAAYAGRKPLSGQNIRRDDNIARLIQRTNVSLPTRRVSRSRESQPGNLSGRNAQNAQAKPQQLQTLAEANLVLQKANVRTAPAPKNNALLKFAEINPQAVAVMMQSELKRVGCYSGPLNGQWSLLSERAVRRFNKYANTRLSEGNPRGPEVVTVRQQQEQVCPSPCALGRIRGADGKCYEQNARIPSLGTPYRAVPVRQRTRQAKIPSNTATDAVEFYKPARKTKARRRLRTPRASVSRARKRAGTKKVFRKKRVVRKKRVKRRRVSKRRAYRARQRRYRQRRMFNEAFGYQ